MIIGSEIAGKVTEEGKFPWAVCRKVVSSNCILGEICKRWDKRCSGIRGKLKEDSKFKW